jgi:hypothetical protein
MHAVQPGGTGQLILKMGGATAELLGITLGEDIEAQRLTGGAKLNIVFEGSVADNMDKLRKQILTGFVVLIVKNTSSEARVLKAGFYIGNEKAAPPKAVKAPGTQVSPDGSVRQAPRKTAQASNVKVTRRFTAPPPTRVKVKKLADNRAGHIPAVRHVTRQEGLDLILPKPGELAVLLIKGHVMGLIRFLSLRVPIHPSFSPAVLRQIAIASQREGAVATGGNEAVILLRFDQMQALHQIVSRKYNHLSKEQSDDLVQALQKGLDRAEEPPMRNSDQEDSAHLLETG